MDDKTLARFRAKIDVRGPDDCHLWTAGVDRSGYGAFHTRERMIGASRFAWILANGPVEPHIHVCHSCDIRYAPRDRTYRRCCNPTHMFLGTRAQNTADMVAKGRSLRGELAHNAKLTEQDVHSIRLRAAGNPRGIQTSLAREYGVTAVLIGLIVRGQAWRHTLGEMGQR